MEAQLPWNTPTASRNPACTTEYRVDGRTLVNTRMEFESYGWGLPARVNVTTVNGTFVYDPAGAITELDELFVSPGRIANHTLIVDERQYDFAVTEGNDVRVHIERRSLLEDLMTTTNRTDGGIDDSNDGGGSGGPPPATSAAVRARTSRRTTGRTRRSPARRRTI